MADGDYTSNVKEDLSSRAILAIAPGIVAILIGLIGVIYRGLWTALGWVLVIMGAIAVGFGVYLSLKIRKVQSNDVVCPYCDYNNELTEPPTEDIRCRSCNRDIPVLDGEILEVFQVRCGYCNALNYYSEKSTGLICEECDRAIPISTDEESPTEKVFEKFTIHDDDRPYDLILTKAPSSEEMISCLQHMLAMNRNQVKQILDELPVTLLTGIPKKKAELLSAQISVHKGTSETNLSET